MGSRPPFSHPSAPQDAIDRIESALLHRAAFPEVPEAIGGRHTFVVADPFASSGTPARSDLLARIETVAGRLRLPVERLERQHAGGQATDPAEEAGAISWSPAGLAALPPAALSDAVRALRQLIDTLMGTQRSGEIRHIVFPTFDPLVLALVLEWLSHRRLDERPFVHLATRVAGTDLSDGNASVNVARLGPAIHQLNEGGPRVFLYGWSARVAERLARQTGCTVAPLDLPAELSLLTPATIEPDRLVVATFLRASDAASSSAPLVEIITAANAAAGASASRFIVEVQAEGDHRAEDGLAVLRSALAKASVGNVSLTGGPRPRPVHLELLRSVDAVLMLPHSRAKQSRISLTASHAAAAGKLVLTVKGAAPHTPVRSRLVEDEDTMRLGGTIATLSQDLAALRLSSRLAQRAYAGTLRPARLFAQLLYGPLKSLRSDDDGAL